MDKKSPNMISGFGTWTWGMDLLRNDLPLENGENDASDI